MRNFRQGEGGKFVYRNGFSPLTPKTHNINKAFTLAEVLITLGIIGVVAALTLPALIQNYQKGQTVAQLKKSYSVVQNALDFIRAEYDGLDMLNMPFVHQQFDHPQHFDVSMFADELSKHLNYMERGSHNNYSTDVRMCLPDNTTKYYKWASGDRQTSWNIVTKWWILNDGSCLAISSRGGWTWNDNTHILIYIDINGSDKNPNQFGKDTFMFELDKSGKVIPYPGENGTEDCLSNYSGWRARGLSCASKIINDGWQIKSDYKWK